jgi:Cu-processing system permease protein
LSSVAVIVQYALREALRRKVFAVVLLLTVIFLGLFWLATYFVHGELGSITPPSDVNVDTRTFAGAFLLGLAMFATLFLGVVLAVFLTLGVVRGDAERGLLQPLVVRPVGRSALLAARLAAAAAVCTVYVATVYATAIVLTGTAGGWWPDRIVAPGVELCAAVVLVVAVSLLGSVFLSATANGIAVFMVFGGGLVAGLLGQIGRTIHSDTLVSIGKATSWVLPFEALYQDALHLITADTRGFTRFALELGPFGGAQVGGTALRLWSAAYLLLLAAAAVAGFARRDL